MWRWIPQGGTLPEDAWCTRHKALLWLLASQAMAVPLYGLLVGHSLLHVLAIGGGLGLMATLGAARKQHRRFASLAVTLGLMSSSAALVHLAGGAVEAHFHFFVVMVALTLYQDWLPIGAAVLFVLLHHGVMGSLFPNEVFHRPGGAASPWKFTGIHAGFILANAAVGLFAWRMDDRLQDEARDLHARTRRSERQLAEAQRLAGMGSYEWDPASGEVSWSDALRKLYGVASDTAASFDAFMELVHPDDRDRVRSSLNDAAEHERPFSFEFRLHRPDGDERICVVKGEAVRREGTAMRMLGTVQDVTDRQRSETLQRRLATIVESSEDPILSTDPEGLITSWNAAAERLFGHTAEQALGSPIRLLIPPERAAKVAPIFEQLLAGEVVTDYETDALGRDGRLTPVSLSLSPLCDAAGGVIGTSAIYRDISERRRVEEMLTRRAAELEELASQDSLTGLANHREFHAVISREVDRCGRGGGLFSVLMLDLDGFKQVNDSYGHAEGDLVLRAVGAALADEARAADVACRIGGDEFGLVLIGSGRDGATRVGERVRERVAALQPAELGISYGVAEWPIDGETKELLLTSADSSLYGAKPPSQERLRVARLSELARGIGAGSPSATAEHQSEDPALLETLEIVRVHLRADLAYVSEMRDGDEVVRAVTGDAASFGIAPGTRIPIERSYCAAITADGAPTLVQDVLADERWTGLELPGTNPARAVGAVALRLSDGRRYGALCCLQRSPGFELAENMGALGRVLARVLAAYVERRELAVANAQLTTEATGARALLAALDARDNYTGEHSEKVVELAGLTAHQLRLSDMQIASVQQVALLHDIGKIGIPDSILTKAGPLDDEEWALMRRHPEIGERIVRSIEGLEHLAPMIRAEHERFDGNGYPDGLRADDIPIESRIVLACDAYHAMTSDRPYRKAMSDDEALEELKANSGVQFCPAIADALVVVIERTRAASEAADTKAEGPLEQRFHVRS